MESFKESMTPTAQDRKYFNILYGILGVAGILIIFLIIIHFVRRPQLYSFVQNDWSEGGDITELASHEFDQKGWNKFFEKDNSILSENTLKIGLAENKWEEKTSEDFKKGKNDKTAIEGMGENGEIALEIFDIFEVGNVVSISSGIMHSCAVTDVGHIYCWGRGIYGQLGNNSAEDNPTPVRVYAGKANLADVDGMYLTNIKSVSAGDYHTCAVSNSGNLYCWGHGKYGKNGNNSDKNEFEPVRVHSGEAINEDVVDSYLTNIKSVSSGSDHTCAVSNINFVYCWGRGLNGRLGNDSSKDELTPTRVLKGTATLNDVNDLYLANIKNVSSGSDHTCAVSNAGAPYCWGQLERVGGEFSEDQLTPISPLKGEALPSDSSGGYLKNIKNISAGNLHTCAVSNTGRVYCWGYGQYGQLGNGGTVKSNLPVRVKTDVKEAPLSDREFDRQENYLFNIKNISVGYLHTCAVSNAGNAYCWGYGNYGQLGNNNTANRSLPSRVYLGEGVFADKDDIHLTNIQDVAPGYRHTCAVSNAGHAYCWGSGNYGQLGNKNLRNQHLPTRPKRTDLTPFFVLVKYNFAGEFISNLIDTGQENMEFLNFEFLVSNPSGTEIDFQLRSAKTEEELYDAIWYGPAKTDDFYQISGSKINEIHNGDRWIQYKVFLRTSDDSFTPRVGMVSIGYKFHPDSVVLVSSPYDTKNNSTIIKEIKWEGDVPLGTEIKFQLRTAIDKDGEPDRWTPWVGPDGTEQSFFTNLSGGKIIPAIISDKKGDRWVQYKVFLETEDRISTPILKSVTIDYLRSKSK